MKIGVQMSFLNYSFLKSICPIMGLLGHMAVFIFIFFKELFSIVAESIYIPTNSAWRFPFLYTISSIYCL